jgi:hypothetical protein
VPEVVLKLAAHEVENPVTFLRTFWKVESNICWIEVIPTRLDRTL